MQLVLNNQQDAITAITFNNHHIKMKKQQVELEQLAHAQKFFETAD
jgi:hypothetical protein